MQDRSGTGSVCLLAGAPRGLSYTRESEGKRKKKLLASLNSLFFCLSCFPPLTVSPWPD